jgi:uncharacterized protein YbcV (DUF1398 family)
MIDDKRSIAQICLDAADSGEMTFPDIVATLMKEGFESYLVDFRRGTATYYLSDGPTIELIAHPIDTAIAPTFDQAGLQAAIREAQQLVPGYTYQGFCRKAALAGCAAYIVSFSGRRALYIGRTGETHVEHFPN